VGAPPEVKSCAIQRRPRATSASRNAQAPSLTANAIGISMPW
jgi:hypothetical protein